MRLIDAENFLEALENADADVCETYPDFYCDWGFSQKAIEELLLNIPTIEVKPVVHGEWVWDVETHGDPMYGVDEDFGYRCSECKVWADEYGVDGDIYEEPPTHILHFCPNCGADMRGET